MSRTAPARVRVSAISLDFGNTLVRVDRPGLRAVVDEAADELLRTGIVEDREEFLEAWAEERERQFREDVVEFREVDIERRSIRVLARLRGMTLPAPDDRWDDEAAATHPGPGEVEAMVEAYSAAFVHRMEPVSDARSTLERLAGRGFALAILSNWPLAATIDRFAETEGWMPFLSAIVVSQRVGTIKPHPTIFRAVEAALGVAPRAILHVGDDWAADIVGASQAGWRTAYLRGRQHDTPLPTSEPGDRQANGVTVTPDLEIDELSELDGLVEFGSPAAADGVDRDSSAVAAT